MHNRQKERFTPPAVGGVSLLAVFAVLCLTVFALLSLTTVQADMRLEASALQAVNDYYAADYAAGQLLARLRAGERPEEVAAAGDTFSYSCPISETQELQVQVHISGADYTILRWQAAPTGEWAGDDGLDIWDGAGF